MPLCLRAKHAALVVEEWIPGLRQAAHSGMTGLD
jgi:hypothetical protein